MPATFPTSHRSAVLALLVLAVALGALGVLQDAWWTLAGAVAALAAAVWFGTEDAS